MLFRFHVLFTGSCGKWHPHWRSILWVAAELSSRFIEDCGAIKGALNGEEKWIYARDACVSWHNKCKPGSQAAWMAIGYFHNLLQYRHFVFTGAFQTCPTKPHLIHIMWSLLPDKHGERRFSIWRNTFFTGQNLSVLLVATICAWKGPYMQQSVLVITHVLVLILTVTK